MENSLRQGVDATSPPLDSLQGPPRSLDFDMDFSWFLEVPGFQDQGGSIPHIKISLPSKRRLYSIQFDGSFYKKLLFFYNLGKLFFTPPEVGRH